MLQADKEFVESQRWAVEAYANGTNNAPRKMNMKERERLAELMRSEFNMSPDVWCDCFDSSIINFYLLYDEKREH